MNRQQVYQLQAELTRYFPSLSVIMVGVAYHADAIPLTWSAYDPDDYPEEG